MLRTDKGAPERRGACAERALGGPDGGPGPGLDPLAPALDSSDADRLSRPSWTPSVARGRPETTPDHQSPSSFARLQNPSAPASRVLDNTSHEIHKSATIFLKCDTLL